MIFVLLSFIFLFPSIGWSANESLCSTLGANCICSEPLNTTTYTNVSGNSYFDAGDTSGGDKQCAADSIATAIAVNSSGLPASGVSSGEAINNLPSGHTNTYVLQMNAGSGFFGLGNKLAGGTPTGRIGMRVYRYYTTDYSFVGENGGACLNSNKLAQAGWNGMSTSGPLFTLTAGTFSFYDIETSTNWNQSASGCCVGPGPGWDSQTLPTLAQMKGKWWRLEFYINNVTTSGTASSFEAYIKNVTDNGPVIKTIDSTIPTTMGDGNNWTSTLATTIHPTNQITSLDVDGFRNGTCTGSDAYAYFISAAWSTNSGQRIGAATEIEGGGGGGSTGTSHRGRSRMRVSYPEERYEIPHDGDWAAMWGRLVRLSY